MRKWTPRFLLPYLRKWRLCPDSWWGIRIGASPRRERPGISCRKWRHMMKLNRWRLRRKLPWEDQRLVRGDGQSAGGCWDHFRGDGDEGQWCSDYGSLGTDKRMSKATDWELKPVVELDHYNTVMIVEAELKRSDPPTFEDEPGILGDPTAEADPTAKSDGPSA